MTITLADVLNRFAEPYRQQYPNALLPSHERAIRDILACRTPALGGHLWHCPDCDRDLYVYHGCRNRSCPSCHAAQTQQWLEERQAELLPCPYFHVTATVPQPLRDLFRSHQKLLYGLLMSLTAQSILDLAANPRHLGATPGILAVLHTWTGMLNYHPHVHCLVTGGGVSPDGQQWVATRPGFFLPVRALSRHLRHLFQQCLAQDHPQLYALVPPQVWQQEWVVHCIPWDEPERGVLDYLARYVLRIAITDRRILAMDEHNVSFRYQDHKAHRPRICRLSGVEFVRRFLQHVLPKGFHKVRYYGLWHPQRQDLAGRVRQLLHLTRPTPPIEPDQEPAWEAAPATPAAVLATPTAPWTEPFRPRCPHCGGRRVIYVRELPRPRRRGP